MSHLTANRAMQRPLLPRHPGTTTADNRTPSPVVSIRQWLLSISEVAVKHGYPSPWDRSPVRSFLCGYVTRSSDNFETMPG